MLLCQLRGSESIFFNPIALTWNVLFVIMLPPICQSLNKKGEKMAKTFVPKVILVERGSYRNARYYHTNFSICNINGSAEIKIKLGDNVTSSSSRVLDKIGDKAKIVIVYLDGVCQTQGLKSIRISTYQLTVEKHSAFPWKPLETEVILALKKNFQSMSDGIKIKSLDWKTAIARTFSK